MTEHVQLESSDYAGCHPWLAFLPYLPEWIMLECILPDWLEMERELLAIKSGDRSMQLLETLSNHQTRSYDQAVALLDELIYLPEVEEVEAWERMERIQDHYRRPAPL
jgi:alpha-galactosidase/6-phospho-beta-glucosidase family protein